MKQVVHIGSVNLKISIQFHWPEMLSELTRLMR